MAATPQENGRREARYRCVRYGIDKLEVTFHLVEEFVGGNLSSTIAAISGAMSDMNLSKRGKPDRYRDTRAYWASKDNIVTLALDRNGYETKLRFQSMGAVARGDDSIGYYRKFRDALDRHGISISDEQIKELHFAFDHLPDVFSEIIQYRKTGKYGYIKSTPHYEHGDEESFRFGSKNLSHVYTYYKVFGDQPDVCRIEFRVKRNILDRCDISTVSDLCTAVKVAELGKRLKKVFRLTTVNPRKANHHTKVKTARLWRQVESQLSTYLGEIVQEHVPESPPERKISSEDIDMRARSIEGSLLSLGYFCNEHTNQVAPSESLERVEATVGFGMLFHALLASDSPKAATPSPWDTVLTAAHSLIPLSRERYDALKHLRCDIADKRIAALESRITLGNRDKIERLCLVEVHRAERDLERLDQVVHIKSIGLKR